MFVMIDHPFHFILICYVMYMYICICICTHSSDSERVISHVRSFGLSTTVGARGDAVSMLYQLNNHNNNNEYNHHHHHNDNHNHNGNAIAVVKVIKSRNVFIQELACFYLLDKIFSPSYYQSHPTSHIYFPHYICSISSYIPTNPGIGRIYAITLQHDTPKDYCEGGVLVMSCAPGKPIAELFALNNNNNNHNHNNDNNNNSNLINSNTILSRHDQYNRLIIIIQECARVLAEFHYSTSYYNPIPSNNNNIYIDSIIYQIEDMFNKLSLTQYSYILQQHDISLSSLQETLKIFKLLLLQYEYEYEYIPTHTCILHGDAHAGNMLWDDILKRVTLIDLPTMLLTIQIDNIPSSSASSSSSSSTSSSSLSSSTSLPSSSSSLPSLSSSLSYHGTGYASRDTCHFERKLQSHGIRRGLLHHEIKQLQIQFKQVYEFEIKQYNNKNNHNHNHNNNNSSNNNDNIPVCLTTPLFDLFFTYRSLMGELTQLVKYDDEHIDEEIKVQLQECIDKAQLLLKEWQEKKNNKQ